MVSPHRNVLSNSNVTLRRREGFLQWAGEKAPRNRDSLSGQGVYLDKGAESWNTSVGTKAPLPSLRLG